LNLRPLRPEPRAGTSPTDAEQVGAALGDPTYRPRAAPLLHFAAVLLARLRLARIDDLRTEGQFGLSLAVWPCRRHGPGLLSSPSETCRRLALLAGAVCHTCATRCGFEPPTSGLMNLALDGVG